MIAILEIDLEKYSGSRHHVQHVVQAKNEKVVRHSDSIDYTTVHTYLPSAIFL